MSNVQWIHIKNECVRDPMLSANDFSLLVYFKWFSFDKIERVEFSVDNSHVKFYNAIHDNKTLKRSYSNLFELGYIKNPIDKIVQSQPLKIILNKDRVNSENGFTRLPSSLFFMVRDGRINQQELRMLYYLESRITRPSKSFCYPSRELICKDLGIKSPKTVSMVTGSLVKKNLLRVEEGNLGTSLQYDEDDRLIRTKFNNHYYVEVDKMLDFKG